MDSRVVTHMWNENDAHGHDCAMRTISSAECTCGKADYLAGQPRVWTKRYRFNDILSMTIDEDSLAHALTDDAERELQLTDIECSSFITLDGQEIVIRFEETL